MNDITSLSFEQQKKYRAAISRGYFDDYERNPREWKHSFVGAYLWKNPGRTKVIDRFAQMLGHCPTWKDITDLNLEDFAEYLESQMSPNSRKTVFAEIKAVINRHRNEVKVPSRRYAEILVQRAEKSGAVWLTEEEIMRIHNYKPMDSYEKAAKRKFLIESWTGARSCDAERLTPDNCDIMTNTLTYCSKKTRTLITVPVHELLMPYLAENRYDKQSMYLDTYNDKIRYICEQVGIDDTVTIYRRGKEQTLPKYCFVSSHTGRRSFATNLYVQYHADVSQIAKWMGHSSPDITMQRYILGYIKADEFTMQFFNKPKTTENETVTIRPDTEGALHGERGEELDSTP